MDWFYTTARDSSFTFLRNDIPKKQKTKKDWKPKETKRVRGGKLIYI